MKSIFFKSCALLSILVATASCTNDMEYTDTTATPVNQFYEPVNGKQVKLVPSNSASVLFEWAPSHTESGAVPQYEVVFAPENGSLANPIYRVTSDATGSKPMATISHKTLSKIMAAAGVGNGETGTVIWGVLSYAGPNPTLSTAAHSLTVSRFQGFTDIPTSLYLAGEGSETGTDLGAALPFTALDSESFEIFTRLEAGKKFYFTADRDGLETYSLKGTKIDEGEDGGTTVDATGVYRVTLDFATASATVRPVSHLWFVISDKYPEPAFEFDYVGRGIYRNEYTFETYDTGWPWDPFESRYKMLMEYGDGSQVMWGPVNAGEDGKPSALDITSGYFQMAEYGVSQWDQKWKLADAWYKIPCVYSVYLNGDYGHYTHFVEAK